MGGDGRSLREEEWLGYRRAVLGWTGGLVAVPAAVLGKSSPRLQV